MAIREFFHRRGEDRRLRLCSYMGVAARNINGVTLHAALCLKATNDTSDDTCSRADLPAMWEGVDYTGKGQHFTFWWHKCYIRAARWRPWT
ncbi:hypothetical protein DENSPDRAFT_845650 [Dentipellis sp. KUC8613]|nr:hypothetical protein DENSPDRAFT_845650 [Dentipellis sp. KUC8613]